MMKKRESGFSLVELVVVVAIMMVVAAMALPAMRSVIDSYQLDASGRAVKTMLQQAQMAAVQTNQPYYAQYAPGPAPNFATASPLETRAYLSSDPTATTNGNVIFPAQGTVLPNTNQLDNYLNGGGAVPIQVGGQIGFNARGMPCLSPAGPSFVCQGSVAFEWFMQSSTTQGWEAITVTPAGRIRVWRQTSANTWQ